MSKGLEKSFCPDLSEFTIREYPNYALIEDQVRTIRSFRREVILVDDILASVNYMTQMGNALSRASKILNTIMRASASAERIGEVFQ